MSVSLLECTLACAVVSGAYANQLDTKRDLAIQIKWSIRGPFVSPYSNRTWTIQKQTSHEKTVIVDDRKRWVDRRG